MRSFSNWSKCILLLPWYWLKDCLPGINNIHSLIFSSLYSLVNKFLLFRPTTVHVPEKVLKKCVHKIFQVKTIFVYYFCRWKKTLLMPPIVMNSANLSDEVSKLLDFSQKLDINLLDNVVSLMYTGNGTQVCTVHVYM